MGYYRILAEFAKLNRNELKQVKLRIGLCLDSAGKGQFFPPTRFISLLTGCGFLFFAVDNDKLGDRYNLLENFVNASKHELRLERHIGVVLAKDGDNWLIDWCLAEGNWEDDPRFEEMLSNCYPFSPMRNAKCDCYEFE